MKEKINDILLSLQNNKICIGDASNMLEALFSKEEKAYDFTCPNSGEKEEEKQKEVKEYQQDIDTLYVQKEILLQSIHKFEQETGLKVTQINIERQEHSVYAERITIKSEL